MTSSSAEPASPDVSLTDPREAYSHKGLTYPLGRRRPGTGELIALAAESLGAASDSGSLRHINVWVLETERAWPWSTPGSTSRHAGKLERRSTQTQPNEART